MIDAVLLTARRSNAFDAAMTLVHCLLQSGRREDARALLEASERALAMSSRDVKRSRPRVETARREFDGN